MTTEMQNALMQFWNDEASKIFFPNFVFLTSFL